MSFSYTSLINEIEGELRTEYWPGAINWADKNFDNAWSKAIDRFDLALSEAIATKNWHLAEYEAQRYKKIVLDLLRKYKQTKKLDDTREFLNSIKSS